MRYGIPPGSIDQNTKRVRKLCLGAETFGEESFLSEFVDWLETGDLERIVIYRAGGRSSSFSAEPDGE